LLKFGTTTKMPSTTNFDFGDIVLVPFPFSDLSAAKRRPAAVVSSAHYQHHRPDLLLLAITSQTQTGAAFCRAGVGELREAGLVKPSVFKPVITTLEKRLVLRKLGSLTLADQRVLAGLLAEILGEA
jgi:mRNA interferase MazF